MVKARWMVQPFTIKEISHNLFIFSFECHEDMQRILNQRSWLFDSYLLSLKPFDGLTPSLKMDFSKEIFLVQLHNLPISCMNDKTSSQIGEMLGTQKACDIDVNGSRWSPILCLYIQMDLQKPLARGRTVNVRGARSWISFTCKKLPKLYFKCGRITHD